MNVWSAANISSDYLHSAKCQKTTVILDLPHGHFTRAITKTGPGNAFAQIRKPDLGEAILMQAPCAGTDLLIQEGPQFAAARWVLKLAQCFCFDLTDTFAGHTELLANFFQRVIRVHTDAKPHPQNPFFSWRQ